jgi:proline dehydrogenase
LALFAEEGDMLNESIAKLVPHLPKRLIGRVARRYIAGETEASAVALAVQLESLGFLATIDILGEDTTTMERALTASSAYLSLMTSMSEAGIDRNVSLKLTQLGLRQDPEQAFSTLSRILEKAREENFFVRLDMEDSSVTDLTLDFQRRAREIWPRVGVVLQARLRRTLRDAERLSAEGVDVRLCQGVYREPEAIAHVWPRDIRNAFMETFRILARGEARIAVATHDTRLIQRILREMEATRMPRERVEFQSLLGVPIRSTLERLRDDGHRIRLYVPFGSAWLAYSLRRLQENPDMAMAIVKGLFQRGRMDAAKLS